MKFSVTFISAPPRRFIGAELMTIRMLQVLQARGHEVTVHVRDMYFPQVWGGIKFVPFVDELDGCLIFHADWFEPAQEFSGPRVAICHNAGIATQVGLINASPDLITVNSITMQERFGGIVVHPPVAVPDAPVSGDRLTIVNLEYNKVGTFWSTARLMRDQKFLAVIGGYGEQHLQAERNVDLIEHVPFAGMRRQVWARTRLLLVPSASESWSMTASEAMSNGIPVVASYLPGMVENIGNAGIFVQTPGGWVPGIREALSRWDELSVLARARAVDQAATFDREVDAWCEAVEHVAQSG